MYASHGGVRWPALGILVRGAVGRQGMAWQSNGMGLVRLWRFAWLFWPESVPRCVICGKSRWANRARIENPDMPPVDMDGEGDGPEGRFFPSSAQVYGSQKIPSKFFMESDSCKRCHEDIYNQWFSSAHHFSSFNNQWYRKID